MSNYKETEQYYNENKYFNPNINNYPFFIKNKKFNPTKKIIFLSDKKENEQNYFKSNNISLRKGDNMNEDFDYIYHTNTINFNYNYDIPKTSINQNKRRNYSDINFDEEQEENYNYYKNKPENNIIKKSNTNFYVSKISEQPRVKINRKINRKNTFVNGRNTDTFVPSLSQPILANKNNNGQIIRNKYIEHNLTNEINNMNNSYYNSSHINIYSNNEDYNEYNNYYFNSYKIDRKHSYSNNIKNNNIYNKTLDKIIYTGNNNKNGIFFDKTPSPNSKNINKIIGSSKKFPKNKIHLSHNNISFPYSKNKSYDESLNDSSFIRKQIQSERKERNNKGIYNLNEAIKNSSNNSLIRRRIVKRKVMNLGNLNNINKY